MHAVAFLLLLTGCDALFRLSEVPPDTRDAGSAFDASDALVDSATPGCPIAEMFSGTTADLSPSWTRTVGQGCTMEVDNDVLGATVSQNVECYAQLRSRTRFSFANGGSVSMRIVDAAVSDAAELFISLAVDPDNLYFINLSAGMMSTVTRDGGADNDSVSFQFHPIEHAYVRIRLRRGAAQAEVVYETSRDGTQWVEHNVGAARVSIDELTVGIGLGTYEENAPAQQASVDDVTVCLP